MVIQNYYQSIGQSSGDKYCKKDTETILEYIKDFNKIASHTQEIRKAIKYNTFKQYIHGISHEVS